MLSVYVMVQTVKNPSTVQETWIRFLGQEDPLEKGMATHSSIIAWRIPWTEKPGGLQPMGSQKVGHDWATNIINHHHMTWLNECSMSILQVRTQGGWMTCDSCIGSRQPRDVSSLGLHSLWLLSWCFQHGRFLRDHSFSAPSTRVFDWGSERKNFFLLSLCQCDLQLKYKCTTFYAGKLWIQARDSVCYVTLNGRAQNWRSLYHLKYSFSF